MSDSRIAVIGMAGRFPGAPDVDRFWRMLRDGVEGIRRFTAAELSAAGVDASLSRRAEYVAACGALDGIENFDADFFGIPPREAELMDPQHRIFLEMAWEALEDAGYAGERGLGRTGVYAGAGLSTYLLHNLLTSPDLARFAAPLQILIANNKDSMPTRVSYRLNLRGPSLNISTACSTSLVAVHVACQALLNQECDVALAGGIGIQVPQNRGYLYEPEGILSPDGHCRAFDRHAAGTVSGNGGGIVVLKRLEDAEADRDAIRAVILGTAINNDGAEKAGFTAPSVSGQMEVVAEALGLADVPADTIGYIEAHGTGTPVGDPIEIRALTSVFRRGTERRQFCAIGSVKTNVGHLDEGAGVAGLIKTVLALEHRQIPPSLHYTDPNPECELETSPFFVATSLHEWNLPDAAAAPRRAGVSSFGIGGTNAHVVLEEAPAVKARPAAAASHSLTLSARSPRGLDALSIRLADRLEDDPSLDLSDVAYTLRVGRRVFDFRRTIVCRDRADAIAQLRRPGDSANAGAAHEPADDANRRRVSLPATPFERKRYWIGAPASVEEHVSSAPVAAPAPASAPATPAPVESWLYTPGWIHAPRPDRDALVSRTGLVVAFVPRHRTAWIESLMAGLVARGAEIVTVTPGEKYLQRDALAFEVRPSEPGDYDGLFAAWSADGRTPATILHLWQVTGSAVIDDETMLTRGFDSVLCLAGAIGRLNARNFRLAIVTDAGQAIEADDDVRPEKSTMSGLVRAVAVENPSVACAHIDLDVSGPHVAEATDAVIADIFDNGQADPSIAYRNGRRLVPSIAPAVLRPASDASRDLVREGGVYLITGGLGSMGLAFAEWIASRARATIVLAARPAPPVVASPAVGSGLELTYDSSTSIQDVTPLGAVDQLCGRLILEYVTASGVDLRSGGSVDEHALRDALAIAPRYRKMLDWCLDVLRDDGMIERRSGSIAGRWDGLGPSAMELAARLRAETPQMSGLVDLVVHCASRYRDVLSGRVEGTEVLYPDGAPTFLDAGFKQSAEYSSDRVYLDALGRRIAALADLAPGRPLKIIEVGGGTGTLTDTVFRHLEGRAVEYTFTDVSLAFVSAAETETARRGLTGISFRRFDVARLVADQDFSERTYDLVVGYNVVHATRDIHETLRNLRRLLVPGGEMCLVETVRTTRWDQMIWGLATGWWDFADGVRTISPLLGLDVWERVLTESGFEGVDSVPRDDRRGTTDSGLIVGRAPAAVVPGATTDRLAAIATSGSRVEVARVDISDSAAVQRLVADVRARFGRIAGVIHTAGVIGRGFARSKSVREARRVLAPKLRGARALEAALGGDPPDFLALCSSLASRYPVAGQTDYAAANAALDGFAHYYARASGTRVVSIGWGFWQELGMIERSAMPKTEQRQIAEEIQTKGWTTAGVDAFETLLFRGTGPEILVYPHALPGAADAPPSSHARPSHPLLIERIDEAGTAAYRVGFTAATRWILDEHRLDGDAVLPGTAYLELMRAAYAELHGTGDHGIELREVIFLRPFMTEPDRAPELRVILQEHDDRTDVFVVSQADSADRWHLCARAEILPLAGGDARATSRIAALHEPPAGAVPAEFANRMSGFGPRWDNVAAVRFEGDAAIARLQLPASFESETSTYGLHPALLDNATGFFPIQRRTDARVPFSYQSIKIRRPLRGSILSRAMAHGPAGGPEESFDVVLTDESGRVMVEVSGYRFRRLKLPADVAPTAEAERDAALQIGTRGLLDTLSFSASTRTAPKDDEVEIRVEATALNFIEVLYGLGMLPERRDGAFPFGLECAGVVTRAGAQTSLRPGQAVVAFANGTDRLFATVAARNVAELPAGLSLEDAATIPAAYMTAYAALCEYGRLQPGERVLIHSACGGVGFAAVHVARWVGARILATAGTEDKREFLRQMGIETVMDSRSRAFVAGTMAATGGAGVDVVLNSLSGDLLEAGLSVLGPGGRFLELGKRDILEGAQLPLSHFQRRLSFIAVDVGPDLPEFGRLWRDVWARVASGEFPPLPRQTFAATDAAAAFAEMAKGRHIGKFVLSFHDRDAIQRQAVATPMDRGRTLTDILGPAPVRTSARSMLATPPPAPAARAVDINATATGDAIERVIFGIWEDLLGRTDIARDDDFFEMNGDSLVGAQVISRMHQALGVKIPLSAIFDHPTVAQLGALVRKTSGAAPVRAAGMAGDRDGGPVSGMYDVSAAQRRLWVLHQLDPGTAAYHIPLVHRIDGPLDISALRQAIDWLTTRHEALRTTIPAEAGEPRQRIAATSGPLVTILDVSHRADPDQEASAETQRVIQEPFDLAVGPLARIVLIRTAAERHVLVVVLHHIIADGVSIAILMRDLQTAYAAAASGRAIDVPRRAVQYRDCARWQEQYLERDEAAAHRDYWIDRLAAPLARIDLPTDFPRPAAASSDGTEELFVFDRDTVDALRRACRAHGATIFMGLVAVVKALLHRYTGVADIVVGTPAAGRDHADAASVVGVFINTLVLRDTLTPEMTFEDVLASVRETSKAAFDHAMYPFDRLVQDLNTDRDPGRSPVFDVMVILQNQQTDSLTFPGLKVVPIEAHTATSKYDLTFNFHESGGAISMGIEYRTSLFGRGRVTRMGAHLLRLMRDAIANPPRPIEQLELMPADERELVVRGWNATDRAFALDRTVPDLFLERVRERPNAIAAACGDQTMTYGELGRRSSQIAAHLRRRGVGRGAIVAVHLDRSLDMIAALLGVLEAGAAYTPMDPSYPADRLQHQLRDSGARVVLTAQELAGVVDEDEKDSGSPLLPAADDLAYVIYTSGSTGAPKGVQITHRNLTNLLFSMAEAPGLTSDDVLLAVTSLSFDIAGLELYLPLITGARLVIATAEETHDGARLLARASGCGANVMQGTPATWRLLIAAGWRGSRSFKALCGGELLSDSLTSDLLDRAGEVWNLYGPTETTIWSMLHRVAPTGTVRYPHAGVPIGRPIANTSAYLLDRNGVPVPRGYPGDLYLGGEGVAPGYLNRPDLTAERFVTDPFDGPGTMKKEARRMYRTGDRAVALEDGSLQFLGRDDHQVKIRGFRVELGEIEEALARHPDVAEAVAIAMGESTDHTLVAYVVLDTGAAFDPIDLRAHVAKTLAPQAIPSLIVRLDRLPLTPNGKIDRRALPRPDRASVGAPMAVAPRDARERTIRDVWARVLDLDEIGIHDNFFELGGHSLRATRVTYLLQAALGVDVSLIDIFKAPTIAELAERLTARPAFNTIGIAPMTPEEAQLLGDL